ncbi:MAG: carbohydrate kinase family protein [Christensenellales bacterium]
MKIFDVITLGIAVMDIIAMPVDKSLFERDNTTIDNILLVPGGDASNQSINLSKLGLSVSLCCRIGQDNLGRIFLSELQEHGVDTSHVTVSPASVTSTAIALVSSSGDRNIVYKRGNNFDFCIKDIDMNYIARTRALSIGSIYGMPKLEDDGLLEILQFASKHGVKIFADMASDKKGLKLKGVIPFLPYIDYFMPSEVESTHLTDCTDCREAAKIFADAGAKNVIIKLGSKGIYAHCTGFSGFYDSFRISAKDTTGAGDAFCAGFIYSVLNGFDIHKALEFASACGAFNSLYLGASTSPLHAQTINKFIEKTPKNYGGGFNK